jgi:hypothetical protein
MYDGDVIICHVSASGEEETLSLSENAAEAHLEQHPADFEGQCIDWV